MLLARAVWLQSADDESITIDIATEVIPIVADDNYFYWELRNRTLNGDTVIQKTTYGAELLPPEVTPEITVTSGTTISVIIYMGEYETAALYGEYIQYLYVRNKITNKKTSILYGTVGFLENPDTEYPIVTYTTPELVAKQLRMTSSDGSNVIFSEDTDPARSLVIEYIRQTETRIDRDTRSSWRENYRINEMHDLSFPLVGLPTRDVVVSLAKSNILPWDPDKGDGIWMMQSGTWVAYTNMTQEINEDTWWIDYNIGQVHFNDIWPWFNSGANKVKINYRWGNTVSTTAACGAESSSEVPTDIQEAATKMVAVRLLQSEFNKIMLYNRASNPINWDVVIQEWKKDIKEIMATRRRKILSVVTRSRWTMES
jgi:hypothetical protein